MPVSTRPPWGAPFDGPGVPLGVPLGVRLEYPCEYASSTPSPLQVMNMIGAPKHVEKALAVGCDIICAQVSTP